MTETGDQTSSIVKTIEQLLERGEVALVVTKVSGQGATGAKLLVREGGVVLGSLGDPVLDSLVTNHASRFLASRDDTRMISAGEFDPNFPAARETNLLFERLQPAPRLVVCGAGHVGASLAHLAAFAGYHTTLIDDRADFLKRERFPEQEIDLVVANDWSAALLEAIGNGRGVSVAVVTRGHNEDEQCMQVVVRAKPDYVGLIGSKRRTSIVIDRLRESGISEEQLKNIHAPIGLDIGAVTPEEVALAIMAEIIAERRGGTGAPLSQKDAKSTKVELMPSEIVITPRQPATRRSGMFRALSHRNYRLFWIGAFLSNVGTWMQAVAQGWLVLKLTDSAFWLGLDGFMATAPAFVFTLVGGAFADRIDRRRLLLYTQVVAGIAALALAALVATNVVNRWMVLGFSFVTGCCMSLASPSYLALTYDLVGREDLANAIALNSTQFQLSRVVGPTLAGVAFRLFGLAGCFFANGLSFIAVVASLWMVRMDRRPGSEVPAVKAKSAIWWDIAEGLRYVRNRPRVSALLLLAAVNSLFGAPYFTLVPVYARDIFHLGETGLALLMGTSGAGAFLGALLVTYLGDFKRKGWFVLGGAIIFGLCITGFALSDRLKVSLVFLFGVGFALVVSIALTNTLLQKLVTDEMRGRVMSMFLLSFMGTFPIGNIAAGTASNHFGPQHTLAVGGLVVTVVATGVAIFNRRLRELY